MIKKSKLLLFSLFAIVASLFLSSNVFAFYKGEYIGKDYFSTSSKTHLSGAVKNSSVSGTTNYYVYDHHTYYNGSKYLTYCLDVARKGGGSNASLKVSRVLNQKNPKDAVILYILSSDYDYVAKTIAIRAFTPFTGDLASATLTYYEKDRACANRNSGVDWAKEDTASLKAIFGTTSPKASNYSGCSNQKMNTNNKTVASAKKLFKEALKEGAAIANGKKLTQKEIVYVIEPDFTKDKYTYIEENGVSKGVREIIFTTTFKNFNDNTNDPVNIKITPDTNNFAEGTVYEYKVQGTDTWTKFDSKTDFKPILDKDVVTIDFRIGVKAKVTTKQSFKIDFKVEVLYKDDKILSGALLYNSKSSGTQRFFIYDEEPNQHVPHSVPLVWEDVKGWCTYKVPNKENVTEYKEYVYTCCYGNNEPNFSISDECNRQLANAKTEEERQKIRQENIYCQLKANYCDPCNTKVTVPKTCSEFSEGEFEKGLTAEIKGPEDIKVCVMDGQDEAKNTYKLTKELSTKDNGSYSFKTNKYCKVSCKEDYSFDLPTGRYVISGRYFTLKMAVAATKTCYTDIIDYSAFKSDIKSIGDKLNTYIAAGTASASNTEFVSLYNDYKKAITDINACSLGWDNKYDVDPEISFDYDEKYIEKLLGGKELKFVVGDDKKTAETKWFCNGSDVDRKYNECIGAKATTEAQTETVNIIECNTSNAISYKCQTVAKQMPTTKYAKVSSTFEASYAPESIFYTKYSTGVIDINQGGNGKYTKLDSYLDSKIDESIKIRTGALPVSLKDGKGVYNYNIKFKDVGEFFDRNAKGRLVGENNAVVLANEDTTFMGTYVCAYVVNCPECKVGCHEDPSKGIFCSLNSKSEDVECVGTCAFDADFGELYSVHQTSLTNFNPTGRTLGANLTTQKGEALIKSITGKGETIYNDPEYSFRFTPAVISFLRNEVNANSENGYLGEPTDKDLDMNCKLYSEIYGDESIKGTDKDYTICQSGVLNILESKYNAVKAHPLKDSREKIVSWLDSDYCKQPNTVCALVGNLGPAWK